MNNNKLFRDVLFMLVVILGSASVSAQQSPANIPFQALITDSSDNVLANYTIPNFYIEIFDSTIGCALYKETFAAISTDGKGMVSLPLGTGSPTYASPGITNFKQVFSSGVSITTCADGLTGTFSVGPTDSRLVRFSVDGTTWSPGVSIGSVPFAFSADTIQGLAPSNLIVTDTTVTQGNLDTLTGGSTYDASNLHNHDTHNDARYVKIGAPLSISSGTISDTSSSGTAIIGTYSGAAGSYGVEGDATASGTGVYGVSSSGFGLEAQSATGTSAYFSSSANSGSPTVVVGQGGTQTGTTSLLQFQNYLSATVASVDSNGIFHGDGSGLTNVSDSSKLPLTGGTMTGPLVNNSNSTSTALAVNQSGTGLAATFMGGNVGIGTTAPTHTLEVTGSINASAPVTAPNVTAASTTGVAVSGSTNAAAAAVVGQGTGTNSTGVEGTAANGYSGYFTQQTANGYPTLLVKQATSQTSDLFDAQNSSGTTMVKIDAAGELGLASVSTDPTLLNGDAGTIWYNSSSQQIKYWNGSTSFVLANSSNTVSSITASTPLISSGTGVVSLSIQPATSAQPGYLAAADYNTFSGKVGGGSNLTTTGAVPFVSATAGTVTQDGTNFFYDSTNHRLGIGNALPTTTLNVTGQTEIDNSSTGAGLIPLVVKGASGQGADLQAWTDNTGALLYSIPAISTPSAGTDLVNISYLNSRLTGSYLPLTGGTLTGPLTMNSAVQIHADPGTSGAPGVTFTNAPTTGLTAPAASMLGLVAGGNEMLRVNSSQVGVGLTSPAATLHVKGVTASNPTFLVQAGPTQTTTDLTDWENSSGLVKAFVDINGIFHGDGSGLTNINVTNVTGSLGGDVSGPLGSTSVTRLRGIPISSTASPSTGQFFRYSSLNSDWEPQNLGSADITGALGYVPVKETGDTMTGTLLVNAGSAPALSLTPSTTGNTLSVGSQFVVSSAGNVGIGTPSPSFLLDVRSPSTPTTVSISNTYSSGSATGFTVNADSGSNGIGIYGEATGGTIPSGGIGVYGKGSQYGVVGTTTSVPNSIGIYGTSQSSGAAVSGINNALSGGGPGIEGSSTSGPSGSFTSGSSSNINPTLLVTAVSSQSGSLFEAQSSSASSLFNINDNTANTTGVQTYTVQITPNYNQGASATGDTDLLIKRSGIPGSGPQKLVDMQNGAQSVFSVDPHGNVDAAGVVVAAGGINVDPFSTGTSNAYTVTLPGLGAPNKGMEVTFSPSTTNSASATLSISNGSSITLSAIPIVYKGNPLNGYELQAGSWYRLIYDGTNFQLMGTVMLHGTNTTAVSGILSAGTSTGYSLSLPGAQTTDAVSCSLSGGSNCTVSPGITWSSYVSSPNTVAMQVTNASTTSATYGGASCYMTCTIIR